MINLDSLYFVILRLSGCGCYRLFGPFKDDSIAREWAIHRWGQETVDEEVDIVMCDHPYGFPLTKENNDG